MKIKSATFFFIMAFLVISIVVWLIFCRSFFGFLKQQAPNTIEINSNKKEMELLPKDGLNMYINDKPPLFSFRYPTPQKWVLEKTQTGTIQFKPEEQTDKALPVMNVEVVEMRINRAEMKEISSNPQGIEFFELAAKANNSQSVSFLVEDYIVRITLSNDEYQLKEELFPEIINSFSVQTGEQN